VGKLASYYFVLKSLSHKTKQPLPHLGILEMVIIFIKLWIYFKHFKYFFQQKNGKLHYSIIFYEYVILLYPNFYVLTVDRASPLSVKRSGGESGRRKHHFREMGQPSAMSADDIGPVIGKWR
jgi:hypothetical protein